ncbi:MAG: succinate dehydrogenase cytochrome b subunit, partial [Bdellovibrionales bacterium]|nr:succinate dehydrogenase cytochrome b subunit [Bdellovibrionales bacterium]
MNFLKSSIGKKYLMGLAGLVWTGFVAGHMGGNLLIFVGPEAFNKYGHAIVSNKPLLYGTEVILTLAILTHTFLAIRLTMQNKKAAPQKYAVSAGPAKRYSMASKWMAIQGSVILAFIIYHLITFKWGPVYMVNYGGEEMRDLHRLVIEVFKDPKYVF